MDCDGQSLNRYVIRRKIIRGIDRAIDVAEIIVFILVALIGAWFTYDAWHQYRDASRMDLLRFKPTEESAMDLRTLSEDCVAWLSIDDTSIDYPVMQGENNAEYLNKDPYGAFSLSGSIFLDARCAGDFSDSYSLLYGHHMQRGFMFGALDDFMEEDYFRSHRIGRLTLADGTIYKVLLFAASEVTADVDEIFQPTEKEGLLTVLPSLMDIYIEPANEHILGLSTCKTPDSIERTVVFGCLLDNETPQSETEWIHGGL